MALLQITTNGKLKTVLAKGAAYESFPWSAFSGRNHSLGLRWYCKYGISYRELQEMLAERGVNVDHTNIYRWVQRYTNLKMGAYSSHFYC